MRQNMIQRAVTETLERRQLLSAPTDLTITAQEVAEDASNGTTVGQLALVDDGSSKGFELLSVDGSSDAMPFRLAGNQVKVNAALDFETKSSYVLLVRGTDNEGLTIDKEITVTVTDVPDVALSVDDSAATKGKNKIVINVLANDKFAGTGTVTIGTAATLGTATVNGDGTILYEVGLGVVGIDTFTYTYTDEYGTSNEATVTVDVSIPSVANPMVAAGDGDDTFVVSAAGDYLNVTVNGTFTKQYILADVQTLTVIGGGGNDTMTVDPSVTMGVTLAGGLGNDTITGGVGADWILGSDGDDSLVAGEGDDKVDGGAGADFIDGQGGNDMLAGRAGADNIAGGDGNDAIFGGKDDDSIAGGAGNDLVLAGAGNDTVYGDDGSDLISGDAGDDSIVGGAGTDAISGGEGTDFGDEDPADVLRINFETVL